MRDGAWRTEVRAKGFAFILGTGLCLALQGAAWASEAGGHGGGHLNWTDFLLRFINFAILVAILVKLLKKPISNFFTSRREDIQKMLLELEAKQREAEQKSAEYKTKLTELEGETRKIMDEFIAEGEVERQKIIAAAERQAEYIRQQAQVALQQEIKAARENLQEEISELSVAKAEEILRQNMQPEDQDRLVRDFMTRVVEAK